MKLTGEVSASFEAKVFTIISNYCQYCDYSSKDLLKRVPCHQQSLLSYLKLCLNLAQNDASAPYFINWGELDSSLLANSNAKVVELAKYLK